MTITDRGLLRTLGLALLLTVASQIFYIAVVSNAGGDTMLRPLTWFTELFAFCAVAATGLALSARLPGSAVLWSVVALSGVLNTLQVGMGLSMFGPAMEAGETVPQLFSAILAGAFFLYFLAKLLLGLAGLVLGARALHTGGTMNIALGVLAVLTGLAAIGLNLLAMIDAESWRFAAGAAGTAATALVGVLLLTRVPLDQARQVAA
ncbi:hypothetical protein P8Q88_09960 [Qipengyuania sp. XHP0207]|uniref:hypothetical protein n=1 Tax=Qipengyuania sp. XHP0207 TaxID=3038078 RepID=UPI00241EC7CA|nr:hypothetical protein [Qipengyuania sp. XHP0207]MDG5748506.1 hypothetical protein [Qipengyuania sp. XHP0207]